METEIFAPKELSEKLREIGFDEPCIAYYGDDEKPCLSTRNGTLFEKFIFSDEIDILNFNTCKNIVSAPTWEQVFKWFREKGIYSEIMITNLGFRGNIITCDKEGVKEGSYLKVKETYKQCREALALELIEIYKNEQNNE